MDEYILTHSYYSSFTSNIGYLLTTYSQLIIPKDNCYIVIATSSNPILIYFVLSISLKVTALSTNVSLSTVIANGTPISSVLAYFFPIVTPVVSVLHDNPNLFNS